MLVYFEIEKALDRIVIVDVTAEISRIDREGRMRIKDIVNPEYKFSAGEQVPPPPA